MLAPRYRRLLIAAVIVTILAWMFVPLVRAYVDQRVAMRRAQIEVNDRKEKIAELETELQRWEDPAYVKQQARERLMFVKPGDTPYIVLDESSGLPEGSRTVEPSIVPSATATATEKPTTVTPTSAPSAPSTGATATGAPRATSSATS